MMCGIGSVIVIEIQSTLLSFFKLTKMCQLVQATKRPVLLRC